jgi:hypothetical protein
MAFKTSQGSSKCGFAVPASFTTAKITAQVKHRYNAVYALLLVVH